ncbi:MAG: hypothetical protein Q9161_005219 [Pseudevernia consocians]
MGQDLPPSGGYEPIQYKRNLPARGFRPSYYLYAMGIICAYGLYKTGKGIREQNELAREKMWSRIHLIPMLQAEEDRDLVRRTWADKTREKELMGAESKVYHSDSTGIADTFGLQIRSPYVFHLASERYEIGQSLWTGSVESWRLSTSYRT